MNETQETKTAQTQADNLDSVKLSDSTTEPNQQSSGGRIAKNAVMLYLRMLLSMVVGLYTSRVVLNTLGVDDFGVYGVVGGVVGMMGFLNASMSGATSRFLTFELGRGDKKRLAKTFSSALIAHIIIALIVFVLAETVGLWFLTHKLVIPEGRMTAAHWVYQLSIASAMLGITQVPYNATIIAHEKMDVYAYVEILNVTLKLLIVYLLMVGNFDKLILYAVLVFAVSVIIIMVYRIYCIRHFEESHFHWIWDTSILKPLLSFSGWDLYGNMSVSARQQGTGFLQNMFFGVAINAAAAIEGTVIGLLNSLALNVTQAFRPAVIKSYASGDIDNMHVLMQRAMKFMLSFFLVMAIPLFAEAHNVLHLWLGLVPEHATSFIRLALISNIVSDINIVLIAGIHATGKIKRISIITGTLYLLTLVPIWLLFKFAQAPTEAAYIVAIVMDTLILTSNILILHQLIPRLGLASMLAPLFLKNIVAAAITASVLYFSFSMFESESLVRLIVSVLISIVVFGGQFFAYILTKGERTQLIKKIKAKILHA